MSKRFFIPKEKANDRNPITGKPAVFVCINGQRYYVDTGDIVTLSYEVFCVLKDSGVINNIEKFSLDENPDPLMKYAL